MTIVIVIGYRKSYSLIGIEAIANQRYNFYTIALCWSTKVITHCVKTFGQHKFKKLINFYHKNQISQSPNTEMIFMVKI